MTMKLTITRSDNAHYAAHVIRKTPSNIPGTRAKREHIGIVQPGESLDVWIHSPQSLIVRELPATPKDPAQ